MRFFEAHREVLEESFLVSGVELSHDDAPDGAFRETESGGAVLVSVAEGEKCVRCWAYRNDCAPDADGQMLCARCRKAVC